MPDSLALTIHEIQEIISSALLAEMDYQTKLNHISRETLPAEFLPDHKIMPNLDSILERIAVQLGYENKKELHGKSISSMSDLIHTQNNGQPKELTFFTSGSTGIPVPAISDFANLAQEIRALAKIFSKRKRIISFVPRHHIYGFLFSILLPKALKIPVLFKPALPTQDLVKTLQNGDLVIAFPMLWSRLEKLDVNFSKDIFGVTSTGPCPAEVINGLRRMGLSRMTEVYGSSETGGVGFRHDPDIFYTLLPHWEKQNDSRLSRAATSGKAATSYILQDTLKWQGERMFIPLRRTDKGVQVGGTNVYPSKVEIFFTSLAQVKECTVRLMRPEEGQRLKIFIVPAYGINANGLEKTLRKTASGLPPHERPGAYSFGAALPVSGLGKHSDW